MKSFTITLLLLGVVGGFMCLVRYDKRNFIHSAPKVKSPHKHVPYEEVMIEAIAKEQPVVKVPDDKALVRPEQMPSDGSARKVDHAVYATHQVAAVVTGVSRTAPMKRSVTPKNKATHNIPPYLSGDFDLNLASDATPVGAYLQSSRRLKEIADNMKYDPTPVAASPLPDTSLASRAGGVLGKATAAVSRVPQRMVLRYSQAEAELARQGREFRSGYNYALRNS